MDSREILTKEDKRKNLSQSIATAYVLILFIAFPLFFTDAYFNVLEDRAEFYIMITLIAAASLLFVNLYHFIRLGNKKGVISFSFEDIKEHFSLCDGLFVLFLLILMVSAFYSDYTKEAFTGENGRYQGVIMWFCYFATYLIVSRFYKPERTHFTIFALAGAIFCLWAVSDFAGMDIFGWTELITEEQRGLYESAFGNVNTCTQMFAIYFAVSCILFFTERWNEMLYLVLICVTSCGLIVGKSDNAILGFGIVFVLLPFFLKDWKDAEKYIKIILASATSFPIVSLLYQLTKSSFVENDSGMLIKAACEPIFGTFSFGVVLFTVLTVLYFPFSSFLHRNAVSEKIFPRKSFKTCWGGICVTGTIILVLIFFDANTLHPERYEDFSNLLILGDHWGTNRGMIWRMTAQDFSSHTVLQKLIGTGPETFGTVMRPYRQEMAKISHQTFDSPHSEFLQYLFTTGIAGCTVYYTMIISSVKEAFKGKNALALAAAFAILAYTFVSFVTVSVPIATPFLIIFFAVTQNKKLKKEVSPDA